MSEHVSSSGLPVPRFGRPAIELFFYYSPGGSSRSQGGSSRNKAKKSGKDTAKNKLRPPVLDPSIFGQDEESVYSCFNFTIKTEGSDDEDEDEDEEDEENDEMFEYKRALDKIKREDMKM